MMFLTYIYAYDAINSRFVRIFVRQSEIFRVCVKTAKHNMEILSLPNSPIIVILPELNAVKKF